jgi:hypothetical protein
MPRLAAINRPSAASALISAASARAVGFPALVGALRLCLGDPLTLAFQHHLPLELRNTAEDVEHQPVVCFVALGTAQLELQQSGLRIPFPDARFSLSLS